MNQSELVITVSPPVMPSDTMTSITVLDFQLKQKLMNQLFCDIKEYVDQATEMICAFSNCTDVESNLVMSIMRGQTARCRAGSILEYVDTYDTDSQMVTNSIVYELAWLYMATYCDEDPDFIY